MIMSKNLLLSKLLLAAFFVVAVTGWCVARYRSALGILQRYYENENHHRSHVYGLKGSTMAPKAATVQRRSLQFPQQQQQQQPTLNAFLMAGTGGFQEDMLPLREQQPTLNGFLLAGTGGFQEGPTTTDTLRAPEGTAGLPGGNQVQQFPFTSLDNPFPQVKENPDPSPEPRLPFGIPVDIIMGGAPAAPTGTAGFFGNNQVKQFPSRFP